MADKKESSYISVAVRMRPLNERENKEGQWEAWKAAHDAIWQVNQQGKIEKGSSFAFDHVFGPRTTTEKLYESTCRDKVISALDGFNVTIFAYGQTSSGKTYTMLGDEDNKTPGIIPLAISDIFKKIEETTDREFLLRVSYLEIYNEVIRDLLDTRKEAQNLPIHENVNREVFVKSKEEIVLSPEEVMNYLVKGQEHRHVGATAMNERSSRSHTIFKMIIESRKLDSNPNDKEDAVRVASLHLVDLAGSEKASQTQAEGQRLREGANINKSLHVLGKVISKLSEKKGSTTGEVIPYRESKLTRILQPALGGNSRTAILCNVTMASRHCEETMSTLKFAQGAKRIRNVAQQNEILSEEAQINRLKKEISNLRKQLEKGSSAISIEEHEQARQELQEAQVRESSLKDKVDKLTRMILHGADDKDGQQHEDDIGFKAKLNKRRITWCPGKAGNSGPLLPLEFKSSSKKLIAPPALTEEDEEDEGEDSPDGPALNGASSEDLASAQAEVGQLKTLLDQERQGRAQDKNEAMSEMQRLMQENEALNEKTGDLKEALEMSQEERHELLETIELLQNESAEMDEKVVSLTEQLDMLSAGNEEGDVRAKLLADADDKNKTLQKRVEASEGNIRSLEGQLSKAIERAEEAEAQLANATGSSAVSEEDKQKMEDMDDKIQELEFDLVKCQKELIDANETIGTLTTDIQELEAKLAEATTNTPSPASSEELQAAAEANDALSATIEELRSQLEAAKENAADEIAAQNRQIEEMSSTIDSLQSDLETALDNEAESHAKESRIEELEQMMEGLEATIESLRGDLSAAREDASASTATDEEISQKNNEIEELKKLNEGLKDDIEATKAEVDSLREKDGELSAAADANDALSATIEELRTQLETAQQNSADPEEISARDRQIEEMTSTIDSLRAQMEEAQASLDTRNTEKESLASELEQAKAENEESNDAIEVKNKKIAELEEAAKELDHLNTEKIEMQVTIEESTSRISELEEDLSKANESVAEVESELRKAQGELGDMELKVNSLEIAKDKALSDMAEYRDKLGELKKKYGQSDRGMNKDEKEREKKEQKLQKLETQLKELKQVNTTVKSERDALERELKSTQRQIAGLQGQIDKSEGNKNKFRELSTSNAQLEKKSETLTKTVESMTAKCEKLESRLSWTEGQHESAAAEIVDLNKKIESLESNVEELEAQMTAADEEKGRLLADLEALKGEKEQTLTDLEEAKKIIGELEAKIEELASANNEWAETYSQQQQAMETQTGELQQIQEKLAATEASMPEEIEKQVSERTSEFDGKIAEMKAHMEEEIATRDAKIAETEAAANSTRDEAENERKVANELVEDLNSQLVEMELKISNQDEKINEMTEEAEKTRVKMEETAKEIETLNSTIEATRKQAKVDQDEAVEMATAPLNDQLMEMHFTIENNKETVDGLEAKIKAGEETQAAMSEELRVTNEILQQTEEHNALLRTTVEQAEAAAASLDEKISELQGTIDKLNGDIKSSNHELEVARASVVAKQSELDEMAKIAADHKALSEEHESLVKNTKVLEYERDSALKKLGNNESLFEETRNKMKEMQEKMSNLRAEKAQLQEQCEKSVAELDLTNNSIGDMAKQQETISVLKGELRKAVAKIEKLKASQNESEVTKENATLRKQLTIAMRKVEQMKEEKEKASSVVDKENAKPLRSALKTAN